MTDGEPIKALPAAHAAVPLCASEEKRDADDRTAGGGGSPNRLLLPKLDV